MNQTVHSPSECSEPTQIFELGPSAHVQTRTICEVIVFADYQPPFTAPKDSADIDDFVNMWEADPGRKAQLSAARTRFARKSAPENDTSMRTLRLRAGLSQTDLAKAVGTSQPHIARLEGGSSDPTLETCMKLAAVLKVDLNTIGKAFFDRGGAA